MTHNLYHWWECTWPHNTFSIAKLLAAGFAGGLDDFTKPRAPHGKWQNKNRNRERLPRNWHDMTGRTKYAKQQGPIWSFSVILMEPPTFIRTIIFPRSGVPLAKWRDSTWLFSRKKQKFMLNNSATIQKKSEPVDWKNARSLGLKRTEYVSFIYRNLAGTTLKSANVIRTTTWDFQWWPTKSYIKSVSL